MEEVKEQRAKMEAEQSSAIAAGDPSAVPSAAPSAIAHEIHPPTDVAPDEPTVSRTPNSGTSA
jgi:hypothetical protein